MGDATKETAVQEKDPGPKGQTVKGESAMHLVVEMARIGTVSVKEEHAAEPAGPYPRMC